jgi:hypothetical protein
LEARASGPWFIEQYFGDIKINQMTLKNKDEAVQKWTNIYTGRQVDKEATPSAEPATVAIVSSSPCISTAAEQFRRYVFAEQKSFVFRKLQYTLPEPQCRTSRPPGIAGRWC